MQYKVIEVSEITVTPNGKELKKLTLKGEGQSHLEERVTIWSDHPLFNTLAVGQEISATIDKKDSGTPIPAHPEKNYVNRTLVAEKNENGTEKVGGNLEARVTKIENWIKCQGNAPSIDDGSPEITEDSNAEDVPFA